MLFKKYKKNNFGKYIFLAVFLLVLSILLLPRTTKAIGTCCVYINSPDYSGEGPAPDLDLDCENESGDLFSGAAVPSNNWSCPPATFPTALSAAYYIYGEALSVGQCGDIPNYDQVVVPADNLYCKIGIKKLREAVADSDPIAPMVESLLNNGYAAYYSAQVGHSCCVAKDENTKPRCSTPQARVDVYTPVKNYFLYGTALGPVSNPNLPDLFYCGDKEVDGVPGFDLANLACTDNTQAFATYGFSATLAIICQTSLPSSPSAGTTQTGTGQKLGSEIETKRFDLASYIKGRYPVPEGYNGPLPACAFEGSCRNVNDLVQLLINIGRLIFGVVGSIALAIFIFGGFTLVFSRGNQETVKKGAGMMMNAAIGLIIVFGAYLLINFVLDALQVKDTFRGIN